MSQIEGIKELNKIAYFINGLKLAIKIKVSYQASETFKETWKNVIKYNTAIYKLERLIVNYNLSLTKSFQDLYLWNWIRQKQKKSFINLNIRKNYLLLL